tara:strand:- start:215 stop:826 length:612 start_codon:yes stop_codon:yes gene_type:complete
MQELGQNLAKVIDAAQEEPVPVCRYGKPCGYVVSHDDWRLALKDIYSYLEPDDFLVLVKPEVDDILREQAGMLQTLSTERKLQLPVDRLIRVLLLQLLYSIPNEYQLHHQVRYNLLFRWFTGMELHEQMCSIGLFRREVAALLDCREVPLLIKRIIGETFAEQLVQIPVFVMNYSMLHGWLKEGTELPTNPEPQATTRRAAVQ